MAKVLIVDDSSTVRLSLKTALTNAGCTVEEAKDGVEALQKVNSNKFNAIFTDLNMPKMDGINFIREVRRIPNYRFTPIMMLTTESTLEKKEEGKKAGATGWIVKPFTPEQLTQVLKRINL
ncbi:response regulator [Zhaonella formicivorans]|uniref:response regulator n=1 Tax=Zhaonella formicivorans TaxID=2528593 RepID=UPI0010E256DA|nr:response regulator [Zhaonella formicivorans]